MFLCKVISCLRVCIFSCFLVAISANAADGVFTASINSRGDVVRQSSEWIGSVKHYPQSGYFSNYRVVFKTGVFDQAPGFCTVSVTDLNDYDDILSAHAKLAGTPTSQGMKVITQLIGDAAKNAGTAKSFMLMCIR